MTPNSIEVPNELGHVRNYLRATFTGLLKESTADTAEQREANFLTRALAAWTVQHLTGCTSQEAAEAVVDGGGDGGIDAVYCPPTATKIWVVQTKFHQNGRGEPGLGDVTKFKTGIDDLLNGRFEAFEANDAWKSHLPRLRRLMGFGGPAVRAVLAYSGIHQLSPDRHRILDAMCRQYGTDEHLTWESANLTTQYNWLTGADEAPGIPELEFTLLYPSYVHTPYKSVYGLLPLNELAKMAHEYGRA